MAGVQGLRCHLRLLETGHPCLDKTSPRKLVNLVLRVPRSKNVRLFERHAVYAESAIQTFRSKCLSRRESASVSPPFHTAVPRYSVSKPDGDKKIRGYLPCQLQRTVEQRKPTKFATLFQALSEGVRKLFRDHVFSSDIFTKKYLKLDPTFLRLSPSSHGPIPTIKCCQRDKARASCSPSSWRVGTPY